MAVWFFLDVRFAAQRRSVAKIIPSTLRLWIISFYETKLPQPKIECFGKLTI
jgi:hypothetical protein